MHLSFAEKNQGKVPEIFNELPRWTSKSRILMQGHLNTYTHQYRCCDFYWVCVKNQTIHIYKNAKNKTQLLKYIIEYLDDRSERQCQWRKDLYDKSIRFEAYPVLYLFNAVGDQSEIRSIGRIFLCESFSVLLIRLKRVKSA